MNKKKSLVSSVDNQLKSFKQGVTNWYLEDALKKNFLYFLSSQYWVKRQKFFLLKYMLFAKKSIQRGHLDIRETWIWVQNILGLSLLWTNGIPSCVQPVFKIFVTRSVVPTTLAETLEFQTCLVVKWLSNLWTVLCQYF